MAHFLVWRWGGGGAEMIQVDAPMNLSPQQMDALRRHGYFTGCRCRNCQTLRRQSEMPATTLLTREEAAQIAREELVRLVGEKAMATYDATGILELVGSEGGVYRLRRGGHTGNIRYRTRDGDWATMCCHLRTAGYCSVIENIAAQALALHHREDLFRRLACM